MSHRTQLLIYFAAVMCMAAAAGGVHDSIFNNFLNHEYKMSAGARGNLEFPRELPGLMVVVMTGILCALSVTRMATLATIIFAAGMMGLGLMGNVYPLMILMMILGSTGLHLLMPAGSTLTLALAAEGRKGKRMGQVGVMENVGVILGAGIVWLMFRAMHLPYRAGFITAGVLGLASAFFYSRLRVPGIHGKRARFLVRKKYSLYYALEFLWGARKQIFITFGPWVLIKEYGREPDSIGILLMTGAFLGIVARPLAGWCIDRFGERKVLIADGLILSVVCIGYGYALKIAPNADAARRIACACFIADNLLMALSAARAIYLSHMSPSHEETASTLSMGISINHFVSMIIPTFAGLLWDGVGYEKVFLAAAFLALCNAATASLMPRKRQAIV